MRTSFGAGWLALLAFAPVACVQAALAQDLTTSAAPGTPEEVIARVLAVVLTSAGAPAAVIAGVSAVVAVGCRYAQRGWRALSAADPMQLRFEIGGRIYSFAVEIRDGAESIGRVPVPAVDPFDAP
jgi:hypothetical protein